MYGRIVVMRLLVQVFVICICGLIGREKGEGRGEGWTNVFKHKYIGATFMNVFECITLQFGSFFSLHIVVVSMIRVYLRPYQWCAMPRCTYVRTAYRGVGWLQPLDTNTNNSLTEWTKQCAKSVECKLELWSLIGRCILFVKFIQTDITERLVML